MAATCCAIVLAAGRGRRMGADKALLQLGDRTTIERVVQACREGGADYVVVVRAKGAAALPGVLGVPVVAVPGDGEMLDSVRAGLAALPDDCAGALVFPVDYALAAAASVRVVVEGLRGGGEIVLPLFDNRPGHPIGLSRSVFAEVFAATGSLRDVVVADEKRVRAVAVTDPWIRRDLDTPADLAAAAAALRADGGTPTELMRRHRSRRSFHQDPIDAEQLSWLVDSARYASTSSFIQAYSVVAVCDPSRKAAVAKLCSDQKHIHAAPVFLAICADLHKLDMCCRQHGSELRSAPLEAFVESLIDASLFGQNLLLAAESEGLGGCMIGAARQHPRELAALLGLPRHVFVAFGMVLGHPRDDPPPRGRMPLGAVLHLERYQTDGLNAALVVADEQMRAWAKAINEAGGYGGRTVNEQKGWTDRMAAKWSREFGVREALADHLRALGFGLE